MDNFIEQKFDDLTTVLSSEWEALSGEKFTPISNTWTLEPSRIVNNNMQKYLTIEGLDFASITSRPLELRYVLATLAKRLSSSTVKSYVSALRVFNGSEIVDYPSFAAQKILLGKDKENKLTHIRKLIKEWLELGLEIPNQADAEQISNEKLTQIPSMVGVKTRSEKNGPLTKRESFLFFHNKVQTKSY